MKLTLDLSLKKIKALVKNTYLLPTRTSVSLGFQTISVGHLWTAEMTILNSQL